MMAPAPILTTHATPGPKLVDLNLAPGSFSSGHARDEEQPTGPGEHCGGLLGPQPQDSAKGTSHDPPPVFVPPDDVPYPRSPPFPQMDFPKFDGEFPRLWRDQCEVYFKVYAVHPSLKTRFATLNLKGAAATWLQTAQRIERIMDWERLCELVMEKFDKHRYQHLLKKFEALRQKWSVEEYQTEFERFAQGLVLYNSGYDDTYFVTHFVVGLKDEIRSAITLHRPKDVDT